MDFSTLLSTGPVLMEGALGERLKREYFLYIDGPAGIAPLIYDFRGRMALAQLWGEYQGIAMRFDMPFMATTPTRRCSLEKVISAELPQRIIADSVALLKCILRQHGGLTGGSFAGGLMGCRGDAYTGEGALTRQEASEFHSWQANQFRKAGADFLMAGIMPALSEALGMADAMASTTLPYIISFTIRRDGCLVDGTPLDDAIGEIDGAVCPAPLCYMANCVHPSVVLEALLQPCNRTDRVHSRFLGLQANASPLDYSELDNATDLKQSSPVELARGMARLKRENGLRLFGGCCGTDDRFMEAIAAEVKT